MKTLIKFCSAIAVAFAGFNVCSGQQTIEISDPTLFKDATVCADLWPGYEGVKYRNFASLRRFDSKLNLAG